jgi:hypothetical protein
VYARPGNCQIVRLGHACLAQKNTQTGVLTDKKNSFQTPEQVFMVSVSTNTLAAMFCCFCYPTKTAGTEMARSSNREPPLSSSAFSSFSLDGK